MKPLRNRKHEIIALLVAAGLDPAEACRMGGLDDAQSNVSRTIKRHDIQARIAFFKGETDDDAPVDLTATGGIMTAVAQLAADPTTGDATRMKALEFLSQATSDSTYTPRPDEAFDPSRLSAAQLTLCQRYYQHVISGATQSPAAIIMEKLNALAEAKARATEPE